MPWSRSRISWLAYSDSEIPILSAEDIVVFKVLFDRTQDWERFDLVFRRSVQMRGWACGTPRSEW